MQLLPFADSKCLEAFAGFERGVYAGLDAGSGKGRPDDLFPLPALEEGSG